MKIIQLSKHLEIKTKEEKPNPNFYFKAIEYNDQLFNDPVISQHILKTEEAFFNNVRAYEDSNKSPELAYKLGRFAWQAIGIFPNTLLSFFLKQNLLEPLIFAANSGIADALTVLEEIMHQINLLYIFHYPYELSKKKQIL